MIKVTMRVNDTAVDYEISSMETLAKFQAQLTEEVVKNIQPEVSEEQREDIINTYLSEVDDDFSMRADFVERVENNMTRAWDDIVARALCDTDYDTIDEITEAVDGLKSDMEEIYTIARNWY